MTQYCQFIKVVTIFGPTVSEADKIANVFTSFNASFNVPWTSPIPDQDEPTLAHIKVNQGFVSWLVAKNMSDGKCTAEQAKT